MSNTTIEKIQNEILSLSYTDKIQLSRWLAELEGEVWDREIEDDFQEEGKGREILDRVKSDFETGKCSRWT